MTPKKQKLYIIIATTVCALLLIVTVLQLMGHRQSPPVNNNNAAQDGNQNRNNLPSNQVEQTPINNDSATSINSSIGNYGSIVKNLPDSENKQIINMLNETLARNHVTNKISDAVIREGSYSQTVYDVSKSIYLTKFIIDIPSAKQSYVINDYYSPLPADQTGLYDYNVQVLCPDQSQLIYGNFNCTDRTRQEQNNG